MKKITTILLIIIAFGCNAQTPDTLAYFTPEYVDSLLYVSSGIEAVNDNLLLENKVLLTANDSLNDVIKYLLSINDLIIHKDTCSLTIIDDRLKVEIIKRSHDVWVNIIDGEKRINADYFNYERKVMLMDSTYTVGSIYVK